MRALPGVAVSGPNVTEASGLTTTLKRCVAVRGGTLLSETCTTMVLVVFACATPGRQLKLPLRGPMEAAAGAVTKL